MPKSQRGGSRQPELFPRSKRPTVPIEDNHRLVQLADRLDWTEMEVRAEEIRASKLKNAAGRPPKLRALLGAMVLRATRYEPYRVLEDLIRHYAPARYLCGLTETEWTPDHNTLHDFMALMGEEGARFINEYAVEWAVEEKLADPKVARAIEKAPSEKQSRLTGYGKVAKPKVLSPQSPPRGQARRARYCSQDSRGDVPHPLDRRGVPRAWRGLPRQPVQDPHHQELGPAP